MPSRCIYTHYTVVPLRAPQVTYTRAFSYSQARGHANLYASPCRCGCGVRSPQPQHRFGKGGRKGRGDAHRTGPARAGDRGNARDGCVCVCIWVRLLPPLVLSLVLCGDPNDCPPTAASMPCWWGEGRQGGRKGGKGRGSRHALGDAAHFATQKAPNLRGRAQLRLQVHVTLKGKKKQFEHEVKKTRKTGVCCL